jgi:hypothetical protein
MFDRLIARRRIMRYLYAKKGEPVIKAIGTLTPWEYNRTESTGDTLYAVMVSRGMSVCPQLIKGGRRDYTRIRGVYESRLRAENMRGYHVSVNRVDRL